MDSSGPAQPPKDAAYSASGNPADSTPSEDREAHRKQVKQATSEERRGPSDRSAQPEGKPQPAAQGVRSSDTADADETNADLRENENVDAEQQLETFAEGDVAHAVERKSGTQRVGGQTDQTEDFGAGIERCVFEPI
jgi:hypothetical protein